MPSKVSRNSPKTAVFADDLEKLYVDLLHWFYQKGDRERAGKIATRLQAILADRPDVANSIRGEEIRAILAELRGDLIEASRSRESEIRKILELHSVANGKPGWEFVLRQYDYSDVSDRLDLLAILYAEQDDLERAVATLQESKQFCDSHQVKFDGQDLLDEYEQARRTGDGHHEQSKPPREAIEGAVRASGKKRIGTMDQG
jgi:hypothetical protein